MNLRLLLLAGLALAAAPPAFGDGTATSTITITGSAAQACHLGAASNSTLNVGTLANLADGTLAPVADRSTTIDGSWCNTASTLSIIAQPLVAQHYSGSPPAGFTKAVNYTAAASGWTSPSASFTTTGDRSGGGNGTTPGTADSADPVAQQISVTVSTFATPSAGDRLVADAEYSGQITVTLAVKP